MPRSLNRTYPTHSCSTLRWTRARTCASLDLQSLPARGTFRSHRLRLSFFPVEAAVSAASKLERIPRDAHATTEKWIRSDAIDHYDFALIRPLASDLHEYISDRIFFHIIPFFGILSYERGACSIMLGC